MPFVSFLARVAELGELQVSLGTQTQKQQTVRHDGCVNRLAWNEDGSLLASGSDDRQVVSGITLTALAVLKRRSYVSG